MSPKSEVWLPVVGWEDLYEVSNVGRVRSLDRTEAFVGRWGRPVSRAKRGRVLVSRPGRYPRVSLYREGRGVDRRIHTLVLEAFIGPRPAGFDGCHNNGDPQDNRVGNLRWDTRTGNMQDANRHGTFRVAGEDNPASKLTADDVRTIRESADTGASLANRLGVSQASVSNVRRGRTWGSVQ